MPGYPTTWTFDLDERTTHMSLVATSPMQSPIMATPDTIRQVTATFRRSEQVPADVAGILAVATNLLEVSAVRYEFAAVAVEKGLQAIELALRMATEAGPGPGMKALIRRLDAREALHAELREFLYDMVRLRNDWVGHPRNAGAYPIMIAVHFIRRFHDAAVELAEL